MSYLKTNLNKIIEHIKIQNKNQTIFEAKLLEIYEGALQKHVEDSLKIELTAAAFKRSKERIAPVNILPKIMSKISAVYSQGCLRESNGNEADDANLSYYETNLALDSVMGQANEYLNLFKYCAIEPFIDNGKPCLRVLPPTQFSVYSDNKVNPLAPTVFIKFIGKVESTTQRTTTDGVSNLQASNIIQDVDAYHLYSDTEFLAVDGEGHIRPDLMGKNPEGVNYFGRIPFVYISNSTNFLIPLPNSDMFQMSLLIPKLLTDLNYATMFSSFSQLYMIDIEADELAKNPDSMWILKSEEGESKSPEVGSIKSEVDIEKVLKLIKETLALWFDSLGMKSSGIGYITVKGAESGIAKAIDNSDIDEVRNKQKPIMKKAELELWELLKTQHEVWGSEMKDLKPFSNTFNPTVVYNDPEPTIDYKTKIEGAKLKLEAGLTSFKRAVQEANSDLNAEEVELLLEEILAEKEDRMLKAQEALVNTPDEDLEE